MRYVVVGACAQLTSISPLDGNPYRTLLYKGSLVPVEATAAEIEHNLSVGLIAPVDGLPDEDETTLLEPIVSSVTVVLEEPGLDADREAWLEYAIAKGADPDVMDLSLEELIEAYSTPTVPAAEEPSRGGSREAWVAYALSKGAAAEDLEQLKRDELVDLFGTPTGS